MTFARSRIDAHNNGDCDAQTCPLCLIEIEEERANRAGEGVSTHDAWVRTVCDECEEPHDRWEPEPCECVLDSDHDTGQEEWA